MINTLFNEMRKLDFNQCNGMENIDVMKGPGFFPGCIGTVNNSIDIRNTEVMVLGQDFDTVKNYGNIDPIKGEIGNNKTWHNLIRLLDDLHIDIQNCFFTNAYMGLRSGTEVKNTGRSPAAKRSAVGFAEECYSFFKRQLHIVRPKLVLVLGKETAKFLTKAFPKEFKKWENIPTLKQFYTNENAVFNDFAFEGEKIRFVLVLHPSMSNINRVVIWGKNPEEEIRILTDALKGELFDNK